MSEQAVLPSGGPTREEIAKIEIGHTTVSPSVARALTAFFLICITLVPLVEIVVPRFAASGAMPTVWSKLAAIPNEISVAIQGEASRGNTGLWRRALAANRATMSGLTAFENALEDESVLGRTLRPPAQQILSGRLGAGNERVYVGRKDGDVRWLFYRPDVEYLTNRGFLDPTAIERRKTSASEWDRVPQPDPRPAILAFHRTLASAGIALVIVPTPVKPSVHPEKLSAAYGSARGRVENPSYPQFVDWLSREGILWFDPAPVLVEARQSAAQYLATDTHWRPEAMELVAERLAAFVNQHVRLPEAPAPGHRIEDREVTNQGDTAAMLDLPRSQRLFPSERVVIGRVVGADGGAWRSDRSADVLVLGDSFSNIYSLASMGWGDSAGFVEHLSYALARPVDRITQNDAGAFATRAMLTEAGPDRLTGKRVVIWQFAARELASGDWRVIK
jgi:alginate O-acetyltransferase complex protein AlgJ